MPIVGEIYEVKYYDPEQIYDNPYNPRAYFDLEKIKNLAHSIEQIGLREIPEARSTGGRIEIAYGSMRRRAFLLLNKKDPGKWLMPLKIVTLTDQQMADYAIHENLNRSDLKKIELARAVDSYLDSFPRETEDSLGKKLNLDQATIANMRRVLQLPKEILEYIDNDIINFSQARELLVLKDSTSKTPMGQPINDKDLMDYAIATLSTKEFPNTVEGIIKAIDATANIYLLPLQKIEGPFSPQFDTADCKKCKHAITTHPEKKVSRNWCTDRECWNTKQKEAIIANRVPDKPEQEPDQKPIKDEEVEEIIPHGITPKASTITLTAEGIQPVQPEEKLEEQPGAGAIAEQPSTIETSPAPPAEPEIEALPAKVAKARMKAEKKAFMEAIKETKNPLTKGRLVLIAASMVDGYHISVEYTEEETPPVDLFWEEIMEEPPKPEDRTNEKLYEKLLELSEDDLAKLIVKFSLYSLKYHGNPKSYQIKLTTPLSWLGIAIDNPDKEG